jgi:hypothetical protein
MFLDQFTDFMIIVPSPPPSSPGGGETHGRHRHSHIVVLNAIIGFVQSTGPRRPWPP